MMRLRQPVLALIAVTGVVIPWSLRAQDCRFSAERHGNVDSANIERVVINAGAGSLRVTGKPGARKVEANGAACASSRELLEGIKLTVKTEGRVAYVETVLPEHSSALFRNQYAYLNVTIALPNNLPVQARDSSGEAELRALKELDMTDSSGELVIADIAGLVRVEDSSGEIRIERVGGVNLEDSSGAVRIHQVRADVEIPSDSSGSLEIDGVGGSVRIHDDSSGEIHVQNVRGNLQIDVDSSGGITARDIGGDFTVGSDSSGGINHENVKGRVVLPTDD